MLKILSFVNSRMFVSKFSQAGSVAILNSYCFILYIFILFLPLTCDKGAVATIFCIP